MAEYIEREAAMDIFGDVPMWVGYYEPYPFEVHRAIVGVVKLIKEELSKVPAADVAPVVHGQWDDSGRYTFPSGDVAVRCTNCGCALTESEYRLYNWNYCPICGAKMDIKNGGDSDAGN
jgi:Zn finger protein HypA/HybF involved in hydrogenase expression